MLKEAAQLTEDERKLLLAVARWVAKKEQEEVDRRDMNASFVNQLWRMIDAVDDTAKERTARPVQHLLLAKQR